MAVDLENLTSGHRVQDTSFADFKEELDMILKGRPVMADRASAGRWVSPMGSFSTSKRRLDISTKR
jgi:hypothetical protein